MHLTSNEMYSFKISFLVLFFVILQCSSTMVKDDYSGGIGTVEDLNNENEVIKITSNLAKENAEDWHMPGNGNEKKYKEWSMRMFPDESHHHHSIFSDKNDMFSVDPECDDGKTNISLDLKDIVINTVCFTRTYLPDPDVAPILHLDSIPKAYDPPHICMETPIEYPHPMISFGAHRPIWGQYGEYKFIPKERWMHNLEHGAVVMLYHPCAHPLVVNELRKLVTSCLRRHIITPYTHLPDERPLALYTWAKYLSMSEVNYDVVTNFIRANALRGPEKVDVDGKYNHLLIKEAQPVSYPSDAVICPDFPRD